MAKQGKRLKAVYAGFDRDQSYALTEAVKIAKTNAKAKFDETIEISMNLGIDPRQRRALLQPVCQRGDGLGIAHRQHFHIAIGEVACLPGQPEPHGDVAGAYAEPHALHLAADDEARGGHQPGFGPPALAMSSSIIRAVTGPVYFFATVPSGAMM